jgi:hypothetical protein
LQANRCQATDGAYDTRKCHDAMAERGAEAVIPLRKNAKPWKPATAGEVDAHDGTRTFAGNRNHISMRAVKPVVSVS